MQFLARPVLRESFPPYERDLRARLQELLRRSFDPVRLEEGLVALFQGSPRPTNWFTMEEAVRRLQVDRLKIHAWVSLGEIPTVLQFLGDEEVTLFYLCPNRFPVASNHS